MNLIEKGLTLLDSLLGKAEANWAASTEKQRRWKYLGIYTVLFLFTFAMAYSPLLRAKVSFIWTDDGRDQFFPGFLYIGRYLKVLVAQLLAGKVSLPLYDINFGVGDGVIGFPATLGFTDPLYVIGFILLPLKYGEFSYSVMTVLHVYLAGLTFSYMCRYYGNSAKHILIGSMIYCFSGYVIIELVVRPIFLNGMLTLPLLIVGVEQLLRKTKHSYIFIFSIAWMGISGGYYLLYMITITLLVYALVRFWRLYGIRNYKVFCSLFVKVTSEYFFGLCLSSLIFLPSIEYFFESWRVGKSVFTGFYSLSYCFKVLMHLISPPGWHHAMAFAAIVLPALILLFLCEGKKSLKILIAIAFAFFLLSPLSFVMNGFQYASSRWHYIFNLAVSYVAVAMFPQLEKADRRQKLACSLLAIGFFAIILIRGAYKQVPNYCEVGLAFLGPTVLTIVLGRQWEDRKKSNFASNWKYLLLSGIVITNIGFCGLFTLSKDKHRIVLEHLSPFGTETELLTNAVGSKLSPYVDNSGRFDSSGLLKNRAMMFGVPSVLPSYNSLLNKYVCEHWIKMEGAGDWPCGGSTTDQRTIPNTLLSQVLHIEREDRAAYVPFGYKMIGHAAKGESVYKNIYALPWGYTYDKTVSYDYIEQMDGLFKQEIMLQAIALDQISAEDSRIDFDIQRLSYIPKYENCNWVDGKLNITKNNARIFLSSTIPANTELYVRLNGLDIASGPDYGVAATSDAVTKENLVFPKNSKRYFGRENYLFNLGYSDKERRSATVTFPRPGTFKLKDIELYALPMTNYPARVNALRAEPLKNIKWGTNELTGTVDLTKDKILCVSVPYSKGWSATVDSKEEKILRGNYMFMALPLKAGHHDIVFSYCQPGLKAGAALTVLSWGILAWMLIRERRRKKTSAA